MPTVYLTESERDALEGILEEELRDPNQGRDARKKINSLLDSVSEGQPSLLPPAKIKAAYEVMRDVTDGKAPFPFQDKEQVMPILEETKAVLSWVLSDAPSEAFAGNLAVIVDYVKSEGYRVENIDKLMKDLRTHLPENQD